jgi:hypothetical protein
MNVDIKAITVPEEVVRRFAYKKGISLYDARQLFHRLELFLETAARRRLSPDPQTDAAWHEFILHTQIYSEYCMRRFGSFIHHIPTSPLQDDKDFDGALAEASAPNARDVGSLVQNAGKDCVSCRSCNSGCSSSPV